MTKSIARDCPICGGRPQKACFPYGTQFNGHAFQYLGCGSCATVFVDPVPDDATFRKMYAKADYHDRHYEGIDQAAYRNSVRFLTRHLPAGSRILDYGCGAGGFLAACIEQGYIVVGVDFDGDAARETGKRTQCECMSVREYEATNHEGTFDAIHLGDVLEHLPDPRATLSSLILQLSDGGILYVEGPVEVNPSPVYWAARSYAAVKKAMRPNVMATHPPTHLLRTDVRSQMHFFTRLDGPVQLIDLKVEETGWPYANGGWVKRGIAKFARAMGGCRVMGVTYGNRFKAVFRKGLQEHDAK